MLYARFLSSILACRTVRCCANEVPHVSLVCAEDCSQTARWILWLLAAFGLLGQRIVRFPWVDVAFQFREQLSLHLRSDRRGRASNTLSRATTILAGFQR